MKSFVYVFALAIIINIAGCHSNTNKTIQRKNPAEMNLGYKFDSSEYIKELAWKDSVYKNSSFRNYERTEFVNESKSLPIDSIIREYQNEYSSIMSTIYPNDSCEYSLSMIVNSKLYYTFILYNWEGTHLTIWGDPAIPTPLLRYYKFYAYRSPNELFFCEIGDSIPEDVKESLMRGLNIEPCNDHAVSEWDGDPFLIDFLFDNGSWKKVDQGFDKVGFWFQVSKQYNNKNIEWK